MGAVRAAKGPSRVGVGLAAFAALGVLAADVRRRGPVARREERLMIALAERRRPGAAVARRLTSVGAPRYAISLTATIALARSLRVRDRSVDLSVGPVAPVVIVVSGVVARRLICEAFARPRPPAHGWHLRPDGHSFPSRHTAVAALAAGAAVPAFPVAAPTFAAAAVGATRLYVGVHWPTDVLAGWLFAVGRLALADAATERVRQGHQSS